MKVIFALLFSFGAFSSFAKEEVPHQEINQCVFNEIERYVNSKKDTYLGDIYAEISNVHLSDDKENTYTFDALDAYGYYLKGTITLGISKIVNRETRQIVEYICKIKENDIGFEDYFNPCKTVNIEDTFSLNWNDVLIASDAWNTVLDVPSDAENCKN